MDKPIIMSGAVTTGIDGAVVIKPKPLHAQFAPDPDAKQAPARVLMTSDLRSLSRANVVVEVVAEKEAASKPAAPKNRPGRKRKTE